MKTKRAIPPFLLANIIPVAIAISPLLFNSQNRNSPDLVSAEQEGSKTSPISGPLFERIWTPKWPKKWLQNWLNK